MRLVRLAVFNWLPQLDCIHLEHKWRTKKPGAAICRRGFSMSRKILDVPKVISLIINELYSKDFMPYGNG
jgi:hypothetical protein